MNQSGGSQAGQQEVASHGHTLLGTSSHPSRRWDNTTSFVVLSKHSVPSLAVAYCFPVPREVKGTPLRQYGNIKSSGFFFLQRLSQ